MMEFKATFEHVTLGDNEQDVEAVEEEVAMYLEGEGYSNVDVKLVN